MTSAEEQMLAADAKQDEFNHGVMDALEFMASWVLDMQREILRQADLLNELRALQSGAAVPASPKPAWALEIGEPAGYRREACQE